MSEQGATEPQSGNIIERMSRVMAEMSSVGKTQRNSEQGYMFRGIDAFMNALHPVMVKHEVIVTPKVLDRTSFERDRMRGGQVVGVTRVVEMLVEFTFHEPGGSQLTVVTAGEGADVADKATNKAMAGALKYAIMQTFMVPTQEMRDGDADTPELSSGSARAQEQRQQAQDAPPREQVMHALDEACEALGQTRAKVTEKWRKTHDVGAVANLDDEEKVPTWALHRFVLALQPYVQQARAKALAESQALADPAETPAETARAAHNVVVCDADDGKGARCVLPTGHDGDHNYWGAK